MKALVATVGGIGHLRPAPGTWASAAALPLGLGLMMLGGPWGLVAATVVAVVLGLWAAPGVMAATGDGDPAQVVIDEVAGQWIALWPLAFGAANAGASYLALWPGWVAAFLLFRLFDIWKPGPVGWADRRGGVTGVMLDDIIAGLLAALGVTLLAGLWHGVIMR